MTFQSHSDKNMGNIFLQFILSVTFNTELKNRLRCFQIFCAVIPDSLFVQGKSSVIFGEYRF